MISLDTILKLLNSKRVNFESTTRQIDVEAMAALAPGLERVLCYSVSNDPRSISGLKNCIIICRPGLLSEPDIDNTYIFTEHPQLAFYHASALFEESRELQIHEHALVNKNALIGQQASIGAFSIIEECKIGDRVLIGSNVHIHKGTIIGDDVHIQSGTVVGAIGVMWAWDENGNKISCAQTGNVIIENHVSVGSNISLVRGAFPNKPTIVRTGTMIAHGTMIGHGVVIGAHNHFANNVSLAGSVSTGANCFFGSGAVVRPHVQIADHTVVGAGAVMVKNVEEQGQVWVGNPARPMASSNKNLSGIPANYSA